MSNVRDNPDLLRAMNEVTSTMKHIIGRMGEKRGELLLDWLKVQNSYWAWEEDFDPTRLKKYNRSEIVFVNLGFNVGSEVGGFRYGVVMDDNAKSNPIVNLIPLSTLEDDETVDDLHPDEIYLGKIPGLNDKRAFAIPNQFRPVSKLRVYKPRKASETLGKLTSDQMDSLDSKLVSMFTKIKLSK